jgi:SSS family solute:Na+ symporter/cation/acetate symporter
MVGLLMMIYVIVGGMVATTWVQIVKAVMLGMALILGTAGLPHILMRFFTYLGELVSADRLAEQKYHEIDVRANTGLGAAGSATAMAAGE